MVHPINATALAAASETNLPDLRIASPSPIGYMRKVPGRPRDAYATLGHGRQKVAIRLRATQIAEVESAMVIRGIRTSRGMLWCLLPWMGGDVAPDRYEEPRGFSLSLQITSAMEAERLYHELRAGGRVVMPLEKTFWAERFGMVVDRFGIPWLINCEGTDSSSGG